MFRLKRKISTKPIYLKRSNKIGILLLHGLTGTPSQLKQLAHYLAKNRLTVYSPLIAGHGTSAADLYGVGVNDLHNSVREAYFMLHKKCKKVFIVGDSFGANLGMSLAAEEGVLVGGIISINAPIILRHQFIIKLRMAMYGWLMKYYQKPKRIHTIDDNVFSYPTIPLKSVRMFFDFIKNDTIRNLYKLEVPMLIIHGKSDPVTHPESAYFIHKRVNSRFKKLFFVPGKQHSLFNYEHSGLIFKEIMHFIYLHS